jgi:hypothetical protein
MVYVDFPLRLRISIARPCNSTATVRNIPGRPEFYPEWANSAKTTTGQDVLEPPPLPRYTKSPAGFRASGLRIASGFKRRSRFGLELTVVGHGADDFEELHGFRLGNQVFDSRANCFRIALGFLDQAQLA